MPAWLLPAAITAANAVGGYLSGRSQSKSADKDRDLQREQFDRRQRFEEGQAAVGLERQQSALPLRDMVQHHLMGRLGMPQQPVSAWGGAQQFQPQVQAMNAHTQAYQPGMGGVKDDVLRQMMQRMGFRQDFTRGGV